MSIKAFIFDLDGVIVDTAKYHFLAWKRLCDELGFQFTAKDNEKLKGVSRRKSFEIILSLNKAQMDESEILANLEKKNAYYLEFIHRLRKEEGLPGVKDVLLDARNKGIRRAIGSASRNCMEILSRLDLFSYFDAIIDGTKVSKAKPDPEVFIKGSEALSLEKGECIVFEDSIAGIIAAHNGSMKAIGVGNSEVKGYCDLFIESFIGLDVETLLSKVG